MNEERTEHEAIGGAVPMQGGPDGPSGPPTTRAVAPAGTPDTVLGAEVGAAADDAPVAGPPPAAEAPRRWAGPLRGRVIAGLLLALVLMVGAYLRYLGVDWDQGQHLHPDERFLTMVAANFELPPDFTGYMDSQTSTMNPRNTGHEFFVYGVWPIALAYLVGQPFGLTEYDQIYLVGRKLSAAWDLLALALLFVLGTRLADRRVGLLAAALGALAAFSIQQSHFFTVETATNLFVLIFLVALVEVVRHRHDAFLVLAGVGLGMALASKISVWPLVVVALVAMALSERERRQEPRRGWWRYVVNVAVLGVVSFLTLRLTDPTMFVGPGWPNVVENPELYAKVTGAMGCDGADSQAWCTLRALLPDALEPYLLPDPRWMENMHRVQDMVTGFGMDWPPNHQWWGRWPWLFPLKNIVLWGLGIPLGVMAVVAWGVVGLVIARRNTRLLIPWLWATLLFLYLGGGWAKTMRYFYPIYPAMIVLAAWTLVATYDWSRAPAETRRRVAGALRRPVLALGLIAVVLGGTALWGYMVSRIYTQDHSRVAASRWMFHNIPTVMGLTVAPGTDGPGRYMPANHSLSLTFSGHEWSLPADQATEPARVLVPGSQDVTVDGAMLARARAPEGTDGQRTVRAWLTDQPSRGANGQPDGVLAQGEAVVELSADEPRDVRVAFEPVTLRAQSTGERADWPEDASPGTRLLGAPPAELPQDSEYYVWFEADGPVEGRLPVIAYETNWDDIIPLGLLGYAAFDNADTPYGEGFYGSANLDLYSEDDETRADRLVDELEKADYIAISSNRVYGSTAQLPTRYPLTNEYYRRLFAGELGFREVLDSHAFPRLGSFEVNDQPAEEAWHVYDHPRAQVFEKAADFDPGRLRAELAPLSAGRTWVFPPRQTGPLAGLKSAIIAVTAGTRGYAGGPSVGGAAADTLKPLSAVMLSEARRLRQRADGTWSRLFDPDGVVNRYPALAALWWYLVLWVVGLASWPIVARALPSLADRGWAVARVAGLLVVSWLAWIVASYELARHTPQLVWVALFVVGAAGAWTARRHRADMVDFVGRRWRLLAAEEALFGLLFLVFLAIRMGNPDLWHPYFGGEKPMDFAYLNATLRTVSFPPYDPWFAGGKLNYYYYGFVFVGALIELTGIEPWVAYNLAVPTLAAMTGLAVFGIAYTWSRRFGRRPLEAALAGVLGTTLAVIAGNLYQVKFILEKLGEVAPGQMESQIPGLAGLLNASRGWMAVMKESVFGQLVRLGADPTGRIVALNTSASLDNVPTHHWYWNASRAIPGDPITEFPFFTFLYADLHAHMMAMPIAMLAFTIALSWAILTPEERLWATPLRRWQLLRLGLAALAIGALWPTNTWDFPTYGLVAAGAIAVGQWQRHGRFGWGWVASVLYRGVPLLVLALLLFRPYHAAYVQPYGSFDPYRGARTALEPYLLVHGIFLYAILSWALVAVGRALRLRAERRRLLGVMAATAIVWGGAMAYLWSTQAARLGAGSPDAPSPWVPVFATALLALGVPLLLRRRATAPDRFMAFLFVLGVLLTQFVEYVVLRGDIGRMNTVFKFYIQVWLLWSVLAAVCVAWLMPYVRGAVWPLRRPAPGEDTVATPDAPTGVDRGATPDAPAGVDLVATPDAAPVLAADEVVAEFAARAPVEPPDVSPAAASGPVGPAARSGGQWAGTAWVALLGVLVVFALVYPVTAARAKIQDRFPAMGPLTVEERAAYEARVRPALSGWDVLDYAKYDDDGQILTLAYDRDAFDWILRNIPGTPTILEGYREKAYRWGSRYSINTGLPTVIGWDWHQKQQRNAVGHQVVDERTADVAEAYNTTDVRRFEEILDKYAVDYVIVGEMERAFYDPAGLAKFDQMARDGRLRQVYPTAGMPDTPVRIWRRATADEAR